MQKYNKKHRNFPATGSPTTTLLRLHPSYQPHRRGDHIRLSYKK